MSEFYILWNPEGQSPPTATFRTYEEAAAVAEKMQKRIGVGRMYVMKAVQCFAVELKTKWEKIK